MSVFRAGNKDGTSGMKSKSFCHVSLKYQGRDATEVPDGFAYKKAAKLAVITGDKFSSEIDPAGSTYQLPVHEILAPVSGAGETGLPFASTAGLPFWSSV